MKNNNNILQYETVVANTYNRPKQNKKFELSLYIPYDDIYNDDILLNKLINSCNVKSRYSVLTRVCFMQGEDLGGNVTDWRTLGDQIYLSNINDEYTTMYMNYIRTIRKRLSECMETYMFRDQELMGLQILIYNIQYTSNITPSNVKLKELGSHTDLVNVSKINTGFSSLPLTIDDKKFGIKLDKVVYNNNVKSITLINKDIVNFVEKINKYLPDNKITHISADTDFYQRPNNNIVTVNINDMGESVINIFDISGMKVQHLTEKSISANTFYRKVSNVKAFINSTKGVYKKTVELVFNPIQPKKMSGYYSNLNYITDPRIGTLDLETYNDEFNISKTYAVGFYVNHSVKMYYIDKDLNSDNLLVKCIDAMLIEKYNNYTFYVHNLANYDIYFILRVVIDMSYKQPEVYKYDILPRDKDIICITLSKKFGNKNYKIKIVDSYNLLGSSLSKLSKTFGCEVQKGVFPYRFIKNNTIFYKGCIPNKKYYEDIDINTYNSLENRENWSTKNETEKYLEKDLISLYQVMNEFKKRIYLDYDTHITRCLTISGLAMNIFLEKYYNNNIPLINKKSVYNDIKCSYFGGITEVYKPFGENLYYYDVNSLYPFAALNPMPGLKCTYIDKICVDIADYPGGYDNMFGFYYCKITSLNGYLGLLPYRKDGSILMANGKFEGWYFSEELKYAYTNGYNIQVIRGYEFVKSYNVFDKYVKEFYNIKSATKDPIERSITKSLLNNLLGRFGMNIEKPITELVDENNFQELLQSKNLTSVIHIHDKRLVTHSPLVSKEICDQHEVDFKTTFNFDVQSNKRSNGIMSMHDISIAIASAVTSYARIYMNTIKMEVLNNKGCIYYTDTDSIVTDIELNSKYVGNNIGKFKLEHTIKNGYFLGNKFYCFIDNNNIEHITRSGINTNSLCYEDFINLYNGKNIKSVRTESVKNYTEGYVNIGIDKSIILSANSYTKRDKIYSYGRWVDTKPVELC